MGVKVAARKYPTKSTTHAVPQSEREQIISNIRSTYKRPLQAEKLKERGIKLTAEEKAKFPATVSGGGRGVAKAISKVVQSGGRALGIAGFDLPKESVREALKESADVYETPAIKKARVRGSRGGA